MEDVLPSRIESRTIIDTADKVTTEVVGSQF
jgi:hypothetical protein